MAMNLVVLTGRLTRDPELKYGQSGKAYCRFSLAVDRTFGDGADFIDCTGFGKTAELIGEYLRKGRMAGVQGRLQQDSYEVNGEKRNRISVIVDRIEFLGGRNDSSSSDFSSNSNKSSHSKPASAPTGRAPEPVNDFDDEDDEFPF